MAHLFRESAWAEVDPCFLLDPGLDDGPGIRAGGTRLPQIVLGSHGSLNKAGNGILSLSGANTYGGITTVTGGQLIVGNASALGAADGTAATGTVVNGGSVVQMPT